jgi:hypothetical protein
MAEGYNKYIAEWYKRYPVESNTPGTPQRVTVGTYAADWYNGTPQRDSTGEPAEGYNRYTERYNRYTAEWHSRYTAEELKGTLYCTPQRDTIGNYAVEETTDTAKAYEATQKSIYSNRYTARGNKRYTTERWNRYITGR